MKVGINQRIVRSSWYGFYTMFYPKMRLLKTENKKSFIFLDFILRAVGYLRIFREVIVNS